LSWGAKFGTGSQICNSLRIAFGAVVIAYLPNIGQPLGLAAGDHAQPPSHRHVRRPAWRQVGDLRDTPIT
jgi:hypothetical protein